MPDPHSESRRDPAKKSSAISTGVEDVAKLNVPVEVGRRLIQCYSAIP